MPYRTLFHTLIFVVGGTVVEAKGDEMTRCVPFTRFTFNDVRRVQIDVVCNLSSWNVFNQTRHSNFSLYDAR